MTLAAAVDPPHVAAVTPAVLVEDLSKSYGPVRAVDGVSFDVAGGEIFGIVGPNGAGKTTIIECLEGLRSPDAGTLRVLGLDPKSASDSLRERIGAQLQQSSLPARLRVGEALSLFSAFYRRVVPAVDLLAELGLQDKVGVAFANLSGGQRQRLSIALALVGDPDLVFFDELTSGLDPQARRATWDLVRGVRARGKTVVLTTHFMEEAAQLCDRVMIIDHGRVVALDTPAGLIRSLGTGERISFSVGSIPDTVLAALRAMPEVARVDRSDGRVLVYGEPDRFLTPVLRVLESGGVAFRDVQTEQPTLEDVFLALTGRAMRD